MEIDWFDSIVIFFWFKFVWQLYGFKVAATSMIVENLSKICINSYGYMYVENLSKESVNTYVMYTYIYMYVESLGL